MWTFRLKEGIAYAPPLQDTQLAASDFIRALEREADPSFARHHAFYYSVTMGYSRVSRKTSVRAEVEPVQMQRAFGSQRPTVPSADLWQAI
jgi:hypothetical protein